MRRLEMEYFNTYYFCSLVQYLIEDAGIDYARTLAEFTDSMNDSECIDLQEHISESVYCNEFKSCSLSWFYTSIGDELVPDEKSGS